MTKDEALRMAIEALDNADYHRADEAITAIKAALEAKDEPVRLQCVVCNTVYEDGVPPQVQRTWVGLTDEEILEIFGHIGTSNSDINVYVLLNDARKIEAKLKEKNDRTL